MSNKGSKKTAEQIFAECFDEEITSQIADYIFSREGGLTEGFTVALQDLFGACLFMSGEVSNSSHMLQFLLNVGGYYRGPIAKIAYEYVISFNAAPRDVFPPTYEGFKNEAESFGTQFLD